MVPQEKTSRRIFTGSLKLDFPSETVSTFRSSLFTVVWFCNSIAFVCLIFRCRGSVVSPREQQMDVYIVWIQQMRGEISTRGHSKDPEVIKKEIKEHEVCWVFKLIDYLLCWMIY